MLFDAIIEPLSDLSTVAAQSAVECIAEHSSLARDGWVITGIRILVAMVVFLAIAVVVPIGILALLWWFGLKLLFPG
jgi:hypothetical protein